MVEKVARGAVRDTLLRGTVGEKKIAGIGVPTQFRILSMAKIRTSSLRHLCPDHGLGHFMGKDISKSLF